MATATTLRRIGVPILIVSATLLGVSFWAGWRFAAVALIVFPIGAWFMGEALNVEKRQDVRTQFVTGDHPQAGSHGYSDTFPGYYCTRTAGHEGPCALLEVRS